MRWSFCALLLVGCGLTLDLEPDEVSDSPADAAVPDDLGPTPVDATPALDATPLSDARPPMDANVGDDAGEPDMGTPVACGGDSVCPEGQYCQLGPRACFGEGACAAIPAEGDCLALPEEPVCGCDYDTYRNACAAAMAGVSVAFFDLCPDLGDVPTDWCPLTAPPETMLGCVPCYDDVDCVERTTTAHACVGSACSPEGVGRCAFTPPLGRCYYDRDCAPGETCEGEELLGCDVAGTVPVQGTCR